MGNCLLHLLAGVHCAAGRRFFLSAAGTVPVPGFAFRRIPAGSLFCVPQSGNADSHADHIGRSLCHNLYLPHCGIGPPRILCLPDDKFRRACTPELYHPGVGSGRARAYVVYGRLGSAPRKTIWMIFTKVNKKLAFSKALCRCLSYNRSINQ